MQKGIYTVEGFTGGEIILKYTNYNYQNLILFYENWYYL